MRILIAAPVHREKEYLKQRGKFPFWRGQGQQGWVDALEKLGHQVSVFRYNESALVPNIIRIFLEEQINRIFPRWLARWRRFFARYYFLSIENYLRNIKFFIYCRKVRPELILISGGCGVLFPSIVRLIKNKLSLAVILMAGTNPTFASPKAEKEMVKRKIVDWVIDNDYGFAELWKKEFNAENVIVLPISAVDPKVQRRVKVSPAKRKKYESDVCFVGTLTKKRQEVLPKLTDFNLKIWGDILPELGLDKKLKPFYKGKASGEKMTEIYNCAKIVLNFQHEMQKGGNMRMFEICGCGAFEMTNKVIPEYFKPNSEIIGFSNTNELKNKIKYFLKNDKLRKKIALAGYRRAHRDHTYEKHLDKLIKLIKLK